MQIYETKNLRIKPFTEYEMQGPYINWFHDQDITKHNAHGLFPYTKTEQKEFLEFVEKNENIVWAVYLKENTEFDSFKNSHHIGNISLSQINWIDRSAEFACVFGEKQHWGKGYCTEAAQVLFDHGFDKLNLNRIWTGTAATNIGMQKVAEKLGMVKEGVFREGTFLNGKYTDIYVYGLLKNGRFTNKYADLEFEETKLKTKESKYNYESINTDQINIGVDLANKEDRGATYILSLVQDSCNEKIKNILEDLYLVVLNGDKWYKKPSTGTTNNIAEAYLFTPEEIERHIKDFKDRNIVPAKYFWSNKVKDSWSKILKEKGLI